MTLRKVAGSLILLVMLAAQMALAQHATVHFLEDEPAIANAHYTGSPSDPDRDKPHKDKVCQICMSSKELTHGFLSGGIELSLEAVFAPAIEARLFTVFSSHAPSSYRARGPPAFLS